MIRVPFFLLFGFSKGPLKQKGYKGTTQEPGNSRRSRNLEPETPNLKSQKMKRYTNYINNPEKSRRLILQP